MIRSIHDIAKGEAVWAKVQEGVMGDAVFKRVKVLGQLPYHGFKYIEAHEEVVEERNDDGSIRAFNSHNCKESTVSSAFADSKDELITFCVDGLKQRILDYEGQIAALEAQR